MKKDRTFTDEEFNKIIKAINKEVVNDEKKLPREDKKSV